MTLFSNLELTEEEMDFIYRSGASLFGEEHLDTLDKLENYYNSKKDIQLDYKDIWLMEQVMKEIIDTDKLTADVIHGCYKKLSMALEKEQIKQSHNQFITLSHNINDIYSLIGSVTDEKTDEISMVFEVEREEKGKTEQSEKATFLLQVEKSMYFALLEASSNLMSVDNISYIEYSLEISVSLYCEIVQSTRTALPIYVLHDFRLD